MIKTFFLALVLLICSNSIYANISENSIAEINYLISVITDSECIFNRNGTDYRGNEAIKHIRKKYDYFKEEIKGTRDFILYAATKSELSGRKYTVTCKDEETSNLDDWLFRQLLNFKP